MTELESAIFDLLDPFEPEVAALGERRLRSLASVLASAARDAVTGVLGPSECDVTMRRILYLAGYPRHRAKHAARVMTEHVA